MTKPTASTFLLPFAACLLLFAFLSCGYIDNPQPPALNIPGRVTDLRATQREDKIVVGFTIPQLTTEGLVLRKLGSVELRAGAWSKEPFDAGVWASRAKLLDTESARAGSNQFEIPAAEWTGRDVFFRVRGVNTRGRPADWSEFAVLAVLAPLDKPAAVVAQPVAGGVRLSWQRPQQPQGVCFRILRRAGEEKSAAVVAATSEAGWLDTGAKYGTFYEYSVQAFYKVGSSDAESGISDPVGLTLEDIFPPAVPAGLTALAGADSIELTWDRNTEADLAGYRVYRAVEGRPLQKIVELLETAGYSDHAVEHGKQYRYAVSSVDRKSNESAQSGAVEISIP